MHWFRAKIRQATSFALFAVAINLALSFGHIHLEGFRGGGINPGVLLSALSHHALSERGGGQPGKHDGHPDDLCPICMARAALGAGLAATAPALSVDFAQIMLEPLSGPGLAIPQRPRTGFQPRGPPLA